MNSHLSIAFLYGSVEITQAGIGSPHLRGTFSIHSRKSGTGYLNLDSILNSNKKTDIDKLQEINNWLKINNHLYKDCEPIDLNHYYTRIDPSNAPNNDVIGIAQVPNDIIESHNFDYYKIPIVLPNENGEKNNQIF